MGWFDRLKEPGKKLLESESVRKSGIKMLEESGRRIMDRFISGKDNREAEIQMLREKAEMLQEEIQKLQSENLSLHKKLALIEQELRFTRIWAIFTTAISIALIIFMLLNR